MSFRKSSNLIYNVAVINAMFFHGCRRSSDIKRLSLENFKYNVLTGQTCIRNFLCPCKWGIKINGKGFASLLVKALAACYGCTQGLWPIGFNNVSCVHRVEMMLKCQS